MPLGPSLIRGTFARPGDPLLIRTKNENPVMFICLWVGGQGIGASASGHLKPH